MADSDEVRRILASPGTLPYDVRKETALCLASHLSGNSSRKAPGETVDAIDKVIASAEWVRMTETAEKNDLMPKLVLCTVLTELFASLDRGTDVSDGMRASWNKVSSLAGTMDIITSLTPSAGSVRDAHLELITNARNFGTIIERNDDLRWIANVMRSMGSEMIGHKRRGPRIGRRILAAVDTSKSMYGEPEIIAKGLLLALTKRMLADRRDVDALLYSSGLPVLSPSRGRDMMDLISFRSGQGGPFADALRMLLSGMKDGSVANIDVILVSKGAGVLNDPNLTKEWESFRMNNNVRVITAVPGGGDACGLTELSDDIVIFNDETMNKGAGEFARLVDLLY
ncbi:MAG: hypothetical protein FWD81_01805 [Methanomassiliicoccaceae archaeon]|nr:hypothetical protein [Methanomassiliicoccaceae archaeon]